MITISSLSFGFYEKNLADNLQIEANEMRTLAAQEKLTAEREHAIAQQQLILAEKNAQLARTIELERHQALLELQQLSTSKSKRPVAK